MYKRDHLFFHISKIAVNTTCCRNLDDDEKNRDIGFIPDLADAVVGKRSHRQNCRVHTNHIGGPMQS